MISYELAKKLKDAGFPQKYPCYYENGDLFDEAKFSHPKNPKGIWEKEIEKVVYIPTLSELIEACGDYFYHLTKEDGEWIAKGEIIRAEKISGASPDEVVANLYLQMKEEEEKYRRAQQFIITEMEEVRKYCSLIHRARQKAGFVSVKYPMTDVKINRDFDSKHRELIAQECNIVGYMDIPPVEYFDFAFVPDETYVTEELDGRIVHLCTVKSTWQQKIFDSRNEKRLEAEERKQKDL